MHLPAAASPPLSAAPGPEQWQSARRCLWVLAALGGCSALGVAFSLYLVNHHPLLLVALSPLGRHLVLVAPIAAPAALVPVIVVRRMAFYLALFQLGRALGPAGIDWLETRSPRSARLLRWVERLFQRASHLAVLVFAGATVSVLAGISGMRMGVYLPLATIGVTARVVVVIGLA